LRRAAAAFVLLVSISSAAGACVPSPKKAYTPDEVQRLRDIREIMRIQAAKMDPLFDVEAQQTFDDAAFAQMKAASITVGNGTAVAMQQPAIADPFPTQFVDYAKDLQAHAFALGQAAEKKDGASAAAEIAVIHHICRACHSELRGR
jgi:hypothetical protein